MPGRRSQVHPRRTKLIRYSLGDLREYAKGQPMGEGMRRCAPWKTREAVELATLEWVHWFNHSRLLEPIGYIPPAEAEANYWRQLAASDTSTKVST